MSFAAMVTVIDRDSKVRTREFFDNVSTARAYRDAENENGNAARVSVL